MIKMITDSSAYFKEEEARALGVRVVPIRYAVNGRLYDETFCDRNGAFENLMLRGGGTATAQPELSDFLKCFQEETADGGEALCVLISSRLSGTFSAAAAAAKQVKNVTVFDSWLGAGGLYLLVKKAKELASRGLQPAEILTTLEDLRKRISLVFSVGSLDELRKSGRIGFMRIGNETILNRKPILRMSEGTVEFEKMARGNADLIKKLLFGINSETAEAVINYIGSARLAANLYTVLAENFPNLSVSLRKAGPVLAAHIGLNMVAVAFAS